MGKYQEIERKFLVVSGDYVKQATSKQQIRQGFLNTDPERTVRVRILDDSAFITVKGASSADGTSRFEWETEIHPEEGRKLLELCEDVPIEKNRYKVPVGRHIFEVDEFLGANAGLVVAEVELGAVEEAYEQPDWLGEEVTGQPAYYNSQLSKHPFKSWTS
ncbi:CYTH domain-containing protein [Zeaxanthinibacter enoshimensis]|uniref:CYTH domain-containing protein n=1 Tax=Zeaxanthinibacter enoshimensis TaxID=392009 RepID=A0A4R6TN08_9FLAO|nr:CYTH domain-containing protein [Zeaxanthinibacter enoshimensis]TDQ32932.1 CYTH domain-containing protein [Zeaxanthinibacter enoshimensis]